ncbi:MAG TPA: hypothetical protein H9673_02130 [Candidatus Adamsella sp.]|nr:hypothetical protein [Candidatus Adamsella sp.]
MKIYGGIYMKDDGLSTAVRGMHLQTEFFRIGSDNIAGASKVGYQGKKAVLSSFAEYLGPYALSEVKDTTPGRIQQTGNPLDLACANETYFQYQTPEGIKLTKDGRFQLDKDGWLRTIEGHKVLSRTGSPIKFQHIPDDLRTIKVNTDGEISILNKLTMEQEPVDTIGVASENGVAVSTADIKQGYVENSNITLQEEYLKLLAPRRTFQACRQMFIIQNSALSQVVSKLGS